MTKQRARGFLDEGIRLQRQGQAAAAANAFRKAIDADPASPLATHHYGLALCDLGQPGAGIVLMQQALALEPGDAARHADLARVLRRVNPEAALQHLQTATVLAPQDADLAVDRARLLLAIGRHDEALAAFETAQALAPGRSDILRSLSELYYDADRMTEAMQRYGEALRLRPTLAQSLRLGRAQPGTQPEQATAPSLATFRQCSLPDDAAVRSAATARDLHVIDDFVADLPAYRAEVLARAFEAQQYRGQNYPGIQTAGQECQPEMERIATVLGRPIKFISPDNGAVRLSFADSKARSDIHLDGHAGGGPAYAGVLYLNRPEHCRGGTVFWQHEETGWQQRPDDAALKAAGYADWPAFRKRWLPQADARPFTELTAGRAGWRPMFEVPMVANRLIVYRGDWFHSIGEVFGSTPEDGRLAKLYFFELTA